MYDVLTLACSPSSCTKPQRAKPGSCATGRLARHMVWKGSKTKTVGGLTKDNMYKNKRGRIVNRRRLGNPDWIAACQEAKKQLGLKGFVAIKKGTELYKRAKEIYDWD